MQVGKQTWRFPSRPRITGSATVVGAKEGEGPLGSWFDEVERDAYFGENSFEKAERIMFERAQRLAAKKANHSMEDVSHVIAGDLLAQNISASFSARTHSRPHLGVFSACATIMESFALGGLLIDSLNSEKVLVGASSHNSTAERTFRYPTEYGGQKPQTAHCTATAAGAAILEAKGDGPALTEATIGRVIDFGITNPWEMGAAMAPAAVDTLRVHLQATGRSVLDYDLIATGDLGRVGHPLARQMLLEQGIDPGHQFTDCGILLYNENQPEVFSGGSGPGCCTVVTLSYLLKKLKEGKNKRILVIATGALLSPLTVLQGDTIPCIAHAVTFEG
ncbi:stage V sporulation protein AD [Ferroacidibacillus organovorans]|uniref:Stage V sporulation protein AD n=1 Tax=Ferroacidibacillus organovorans TaxID=1765683 RepID=A0A161QEZ7_9BACL|nr:stage V sporulation protein AD [Ferroacidibacillus organovorans]KYP80440.1 stage V sporulation protein AD [Ferroacidibacillus organovorans]OAG94667.1 stage V sporulation protein AD [Ferroacidibacillus organovorans]OPG16619.1 stage V sporulation protein AD [Ferroacidibacillus organovorans]